MLQNEPALIDQCRNMFGPLSRDAKTRLWAVLFNPNQETWDDAYSLLVAGGKVTLWQAWLAIDPEAPTRKGLEEPWPTVPSQWTLYRAIREAVNDPESAWETAHSRLYGGENSLF